MRRPSSASIALALATIGSAAGCGDQIVGSFDGTAGSDGTHPTLAPDDTNAPSEGPPPSPEVCDGLDNDLDGLVDEVAAGVSECQDCRLLQGEGQAWWVCPDPQLTWSAAEARCGELGAHLAIVPTDASQQFLHAEIGEGFWWLGARQTETNGPWVWVDDTPLGYANWGDVQPDDIAPGQDCLRLTFGIVGRGWFDGAWDDFFCDDVHPVLCSAPHAR